MRKLLLILFLFVGSLSYGQTVFTQTYVDRCTGNTQVVVANFVNGSATVAFYNKVRTFTYQQFLNGELQSWLTETYLWWEQLSPCSTATSEAQNAQQTAQNATAAAATASTAANSAASSASTAGSTATTTGGTTQSTTSGGTTDATSNSSTNNTSSSSNTESTNQSSSGTSESSQSETGNTGGGGETSENTGGGETSDNGGGSSEESKTEETKTEESKTEEKTEEVKEETKEESKEETKEEETKEESKEEEKKEEESKEEESDEESSEEESDEESSEEESEEKEEKKQEKKQKQKKQRKMMPVQLRSDMMANQALLGNYDIVTSVGATQSSIYGDESYGATAMIWSNLRQFSLNGSYTKVHMQNFNISTLNHDNHQHFSITKDVDSDDPITPPVPKLTHITSASVGYMNNFGNGAVMANMMKIKPTKYGTFGAGINMGNMFGENSYQITMVGYNVLYTNQVMLNSRINYAPAFIWSQSPYVGKLEWVRDDWGRNSLQAKNQLRGTRIHGMMILANSFTIQLTRRFSFNAGATFIKSTDPNIPLIKSFMIGAKLPF